MTCALGALRSSVVQQRNGVLAAIGAQVGRDERVAQRVIAGAVLGHALLQPVERVVRRARPTSSSCAMRT